MSEGAEVGKIKDFILNEFLPGEDASMLTESTELVTTGILDSIATLRIVTFLEEEFSISVEPHEADADNLNTITDMVNLIQAKRGQSAS